MEEQVIAQDGGVLVSKKDKNKDVVRLGYVFFLLFNE